MVNVPAVVSLRLIGIEGEKGKAYSSEAEKFPGVRSELVKNFNETAQ